MFPLRSQQDEDATVSIRSLALAGAAFVALAASLGVAQADEQDEEVRRLNLEQLEKARAENAADTVMPAPKPDGQGGPEFTRPPTPDEGMTDEEEAGDDPVVEDEAPDADDPAEDDATSPPE